MVGVSESSFPWGGIIILSWWVLASISVDRSLTSVMDKTSLPLSILLASWLSPLNREVSPHQSAEEGDMIWIILFKNEMRMGKPCWRMTAPRKSQLQPCAWDHQGNLFPKHCTGWWLETEGTWLICTTPWVEKHIIQERLDCHNCPWQECLFSEALSLHFRLALCSSQDLKNNLNTGCHQCYISLSLSKCDWFAKIKPKFMISSKGS